MFAKAVAVIGFGGTCTLEFWVSFSSLVVIFCIASSNLKGNALYIDVVPSSEYCYGFEFEETFDQAEKICKEAGALLNFDQKFEKTG